MAVVNINQGTNSIELDFAPNGIIRKTSYPKSAFGFFEFKDFEGVMIVQITAISDNLTPSQIAGVTLAETPIAPDPTILRIQNWDNVALATTEELYEKIKAFINS